MRIDGTHGVELALQAKDEGKVLAHPCIGARQVVSRPDLTLGRVEQISSQLSGPGHAARGTLSSSAPPSASRPSTSRQHCATAEGAGW